MARCVMGRPKVRPSKRTLKARIDAGDTYKAIAEDYGVWTGTVSKWTKLYKIAPGCRKGEKHHSALITVEDAKLISLLEGELLGIEVAEKFETTPRVVYEIWRGNTWSHCT